MFKKVKGMIIVLCMFMGMSTVFGRAVSSIIVSDVNVQQGADALEIQVVATSLPKYTVSELKNPFRIVLDMPGSVYPKVSKTVMMDASPVRKIRLQQFQKNIVRLVVELDEQKEYQVSQTADGFMVSIASVHEPEPEVLSNTPTSADEAMLASPGEVTAIELKKEGNNILVTMKGKGKLKYKFKEVSSPPSYSVQIPNAKLSASTEEIFVEALGVQRIVPSQKKDDVQVTVFLEKPLPYDIALVDDGKSILLTVEGEAKQKNKDKEKVAATPVTKDDKKEETKTDKKDEKKKEETVVTEVKKEEKKTEEIKGPKITAVEAQEKDNKVSVKISSTDALQYDVKELQFPARIELKFKDAWAATKTGTVDVNKGAVRGATITQSNTSPAEAKVKITLVRMVPYEVNLENDGKDIILNFETTKEVSDILAKEKEAVPEVKTETKTEPVTNEVVVTPVKETKKETKKKKGEVKKETVKVPVVVKETPPETVMKTSASAVIIKGVDVKKLQDKILLYVTGSAQLRYKIRESENPDKVIFEFYNAVLGMKEKSVDVIQGNVTKARVYQSQKTPVPVVRVALDLEAKTKYEAQLTPEGKQLLVTAEAQKSVIPAVKKITKTPAMTTTSKKLPSLPIPQIPAIPSYVTDKINMDFKDADVRDVLRIFGEITGMNVIVAPDVPAGILITLSLKDVPLGQAIDMVVHSVSSTTATTTTGTTGTTGTTTSTTGGGAVTGGNLLYRIIGNTIVVSFSQNVLDQMGSGVLAGDLNVETFAIKGYTRGEFTNILRKVAPELTVIDTPDRPKDLITLVGPKYSLSRARTLIMGLTPVPEVQVETFNVGNLDPSDVETALKSAIPEASVVDKKKGNPPNFISISGAVNTLKKVEKFTADLTLKQNVTFDVVQTRETKPDEIEKLLKSFVPGVQVVRSLVGSDTYSTTLAGTADEITAAKKLIENLEGGTGRTKGAMTVESIQLKNIDTVATLQEQGVDIESLLRNMVPGLSDNAKVFLDKRNNTIVVSAAVSDIEKVKKAVEKIDVRLPQVSIEARVVDFTTSGSKSFSANFVEKVGTSATPVGIQMTDKGNFIGTGTFSFNMLGTKFVATLNDLVQQGKARVLASPKVLTLSGKSATITLTDQIPYTVETSTTGQFGQVVVTKNTNYEPVGITLTLTPRINENGEILLQINPKVETITSTPAPGQRPSKNSREVNTLMRITDGGSVIIGGLINSSERETMAKIPILSSLPLVGKLFKSTNNSKSDSELSIIITANIVEE